MIKDFDARRIDEPKLYDAIKTQDLNSIRRIVEMRPELIDSFTFLAGGGYQHYAASNGKIDALGTLFQSGFSRDLRNGRDGDLPICSASRFGHADVVAYLISLGQPLEVTPSVCNPLLAAISGGRSAECVRLLLDAGIDAAHRYKGGPRGEMTATAYALMHGLPEIADMIAAHLAKGDENMQDEILKDAYRILKKQPPMKQRRILPSEEDLEPGGD